jgi:hypothetical protein
MMIIAIRYSQIPSIQVQFTTSLYRVDIKCLDHADARTDWSCSTAVAGDKNSIQAAAVEGAVSKCGQVMQNDNCNNMSVFQVSNQLKAMEVGTEVLVNKENIPGVAMPKRLIVEPSFAMDWLEISWDELDLKERVGAGTSLASVFLFNLLPDVKVITLHWNNAGSFGTVYRADWHGSVSTLDISLWKSFIFALS